MAKVQGFDDGRTWVFQCPGCETWHSFSVPRWSFNGDVAKPTFSPSLLYPGRPGSKRCHSFVEGGMIRFLTDCDHALAGKTVELPEMEGT